MKYTKIVEFYEKIEQTTKRLEMTDYLVGLFKETPKEIIDKVVYLTRGKIYPDFVELELGVAEKMAMRAIANATGATIKDIEEDFKKTGDLGLTTENFIKRKRQLTLFAKPLTVDHVYNIFDKIAKATGEGSQDLKIRLLSGLLTNAQPNEGKYIIRTVTGRLRLGIADMTILDALAIAFTGS
ncbi:MAG: ATP-dependent DNA ligase, partial [Candidatus Asgardarchaeum californiense]